MDFPGKKGGERKRQRLQARLNNTFRHSLGLHRVNDSAVFAADRQVAVATHAHASNASSHLVAADGHLARTAVADVERALARLDARNRSFDAAKVRVHLRKARRAIQQAGRLQQAGSRPDDIGNGKSTEKSKERGNHKSKGNSKNNGETAGNGNQGGPSPAAIITHYRRAWTEAQHALDLLDREVTPTVTITKRVDPVHSGTRNYTVQGTVFDVRTHAVELTVSVNGEARATRLVANATPATTGQFGLVVQLDQPVNEITVTATDPGEPFSRLSEPWPAQSAEDTLRLDGDGLHDGEEVGQRVVLSRDGRTVAYYRITSMPDAVHSDADGIDDYTEDRGWTVNVTWAASGEPLRWNPNSTKTMLVRSEPLAVHSDDDGLSDQVEKEDLHTDPSSEVTYEITRQHQRQVVDRFAAAWEHEWDSLYGHPTEITEAARALGILDRDGTGGQLAHIRLTDATDDFDFVRADDGGLAFRALDRRTRTDTWLSNHAEYRVSQFRHYTIDPWDPDTDDDGLTDGQELNGITRTMSGELNEIHRELNLGTSPADPDTDDDGYWDGWLGVYGAGNSTNVVLYMEHLVDDDDGDGETRDEGVNGVETVPAQTGIHRVHRDGQYLPPINQVVPSGSSANVDGDGWTDHSNIHAGELHWWTHPRDSSDTPEPGLTIEVDFHNQSTQNLWRRTTSGDLVSPWAERIEDNYALYGIDVDLQPDEVITDAELRTHEVFGVDPVTAPFNIPELATIGNDFHQTPDTQYFFVANNTNSDLLGTFQTGTNFYFLGNALYKVLPAFFDPQGLFIFTENHPHDLAKRKTAVHEIAHSFQIGEVDDDCSKRLFRGGEIYSGEPPSPKDPTPESLNRNQEWSLMASGWKAQQMKDSPMNGTYLAFSVEELATATTAFNPPCV